MGVYIFLLLLWQQTLCYLTSSCISIFRAIFIFFNFILFFFSHAVHDLSPWPEIEARPRAMKALSSNHWTAGEFPRVTFSWVSSVLGTGLSIWHVSTCLIFTTCLSSLGHIFWTGFTYLFFSVFCCFCLYRMACRILVPPPEVEPVPSLCVSMES